MIYETKMHECFLCGRDLQAAVVLWDREKVGYKVTNVMDDDGKLVHGKTVLCDCGLAQALEPMTEDTLNNFYTEVNGLSEYRRIYPVPPISTNLHMQNTIALLIKVMPKELQQQKGLRFLVIGSGDLQAIKMIEDTFQTSRAYTHDPGLPESNYNFKNFPEGEKFDFIICNNTLEHVFNPVTFMRKVRTICTLTTKLIFSVPDLFTTLATCPRSIWFSSAHLYHFNIDTIQHLLVRSGFYLEIVSECPEEVGHKIYMVLQIHPNNAGKEIHEMTRIGPLTQELKDLIIKHTQILERLYFSKVSIMSEYTKIRQKEEGK